jgi:CHAT domain-containing protein
VSVSGPLPSWLRQRTALAERMRFLYLGQRARAETVVQQRQPGLVEQLVAQQLHVRTYQPDFSRTLFQLLVPHDFKDAARGLDRVVLVVDGYTANFPWEMMLASDAPVSVKAAVVRQLSSTRFRQRVQQTAEPRAFVIGNPSYSGFTTAFPRNKADPPALPAAENEANAVAQVLGQYRYDVVSCIGADQQAIDVVTRLYQHPYRVLHIAAHGVFEEPHADGSKRTGVVLSNGLLITAAEIAAMEVVPDLVFLNCCHLGKVDRAPTEYNRLAYSVARELIEMGVRAVVAAGWAVDDDAASLFAETFYRALLGEARAFGDAVWEARKAVWRDYPTSTTWGAYQAYGDPGWQLRTREDIGGTVESKARWSPVAPEELLSEIDKLRMDVGRLPHVLSASEQKEVDRAVQALLRKLPEADWAERLDVSTALGRLYADLGSEWFATAAAHLQRAIERHDMRGSAPIAAIEQLANLEACDGEARGDAARVERAIARLRQLLRVAGATPEAKADPEPGANKERAGLLGSAYKRLAAVHARAALSAADATARTSALRAMRAALDHSERWYFGEVSLDEPQPDPYTGINWLFLATLQPASAELRAKKLLFAQRCVAVAEARFRATPDVWSAVSAPNGALVQQLQGGALGGAQAEAAVAQALRAYREALQGLSLRPKQLHSTVEQLCLLALFNEALAAGRSDTHARTAASLRAIADALLPGACADAGAPASAQAPTAPKSTSAAPRAARTAGKSTATRQAAAAGQSTARRARKRKA